MKLLPYAVLVLLLAAVGLQLGARPPARQTDLPPLARLLPAQIDGWRTYDQPVAETAEIQRAVGELLNYDDALLRTYRRGTREFSVYIAHWKPGKMSHRLVAGHTPDVCWTAGGWQCTARQPRLSFAEVAELPPGQARTFLDPSTYARQFVVFWHVAGTRLIDYPEGGVPPWWAPLADLWRHGLRQREEQFFIRLSSSQPLETWARDSDFRSVLRALAPLFLQDGKRG